MAVVGILLGVLLIGYGLLQSVGVHYRLSTYKEETGRVLSVSIVKRDVPAHTHTVKMGKGIGSVSIPERAYYRPLVTYEYQVGGQRYVSWRYDLTETAGPEAWANEIAARFPAGSTMTVFYNPRQPERSVLTKSIHPSGFWFVWGLSAASFFIGLALIFGCLNILKHLQPGTVASRA